MFNNPEPTARVQKEDRMYRLAPHLWSGFLAVAFGATAVAATETLPPREPSPLTVRQIHSGHSLTDSYMSHPWPGRLILALETLPGSRPQDTVFASTIPGSPLQWRWDNPTSFPDARKDIAQFDLLVTTEAVPLSANEDWFRESTLAQIDRWVAHAWAEGRGGEGAEVMLYSTWIPWRYTQGVPDNDPEAGVPFRERLEIEGERWEQIQDHANANRPSGMPPVYMIPGHRLMMRLHDDIVAGRAPGLGSIGDVFSDDIHLNAIGNYAVTMLVLAVIHQRDPQDLPDRLADEDRAIPADLAAYLKRTAWEVATEYGRSGLPRS